MRKSALLSQLGVRQRYKSQPHREITHTNAPY